MSFEISRRILKRWLSADFGRVSLKAASCLHINVPLDRLYTYRLSVCNLRKRVFAGVLLCGISKRSYAAHSGLLSCHLFVYDVCDKTKQKHASTSLLTRAREKNLRYAPADEAVRRWAARVPFPLQVKILSSLGRHVRCRMLVCIEIALSLFVPYAIISVGLPPVRRHDSVVPTLYTAARFSLSEESAPTMAYRLFVRNLLGGSIDSPDLPGEISLVYYHNLI